MKRLVNFSHPLSEDALRALAEELAEDVHEVVVSVQLDLDRPLTGQIDDLLVNAGVYPLDQFDLIVPPALGPAAYILAAQHLRLDVSKRPTIVWTKRENGIPPRFVLGGVE